MLWERICFINSVPFFVCSLDPSKSIFRELQILGKIILMRHLLSSCYPLGKDAKNNVYLQTLGPSGDFYLPSNVSVDHLPRSVFLSNIMSVLYLLLNGRMALRKNFSVVFLKEAVATLRLILYRSQSCCGVTSECLSLLWNVCNVGTSVNPGSMLSLRSKKSRFL